MTIVVLVGIGLFFCVAVYIGNKPYQTRKIKYDGTITVSPSEDGTTVTLNLDLDDVVDKNKIILKVVAPPETA